MLNSEKASHCDVIIVGGGPAGLMAAIAAASRGAKVTMLEKLHAPAAKLLASGGGRCNLTNTLDREKFIASYGRQGRFTTSAMDAMGPDALREFLAALGVQTCLQDQGRVYPVSNSAVQVAQAILARCRELGVRIITSCRAEGLIIEDGKVVGVSTSKQPHTAPLTIIACGGAGYPRLGGGRDGYELAKQAGHEIVPPTPALAPLVASGLDFPALAGVSLPNATVRIALPGQSRTGYDGQVLFTHRGISGPVVLDISGMVAQLIQKHGPVVLEISVVARRSRDDWRKFLDQSRQQRGALAIASVLASQMPAALARAICLQFGANDNPPVAQMDAKQLDDIASAAGGLRCTVSATEGFDNAMVTRGGVALKEVDPQTLRSKKIEGLAFAGEVLDIDGPCGGFNLQWAFASGFLAGNSPGK